MSDTGYITRANLPTPAADLELFTGGPPATFDFALDGLNPGQTKKRRQICEAMWIPGAGQLGSSPGMADPSLALLVTGADKETLDANIGDLVTAVCRQPTWELHVNFGGVSEWAWTFWDADEPTIGMSPAFWRLLDGSTVLWTTVTVVSQRDPILVAGPYVSA